MPTGIYKRKLSELKICYKCKIFLPRSRFNKANGKYVKKNGEKSRSWRSICKDCQNKIANSRDRKKYDSEYYVKYNSILENRIKRNARNKCRYAVKIGKILKEKCKVCGKNEVEAHHEDYSKPLEVIWLCHRHHMEYNHGLEKKVIENY